MRIAFVGKGGSGKTTLAVLFSQFIRRQGADVIVVDADINAHVALLLGFDDVPREKHLSHPDVGIAIRNCLRGDNPRITEIAAFRKTTPPAAGSGLIVLDDENDPMLSRFSVGKDGMRLMVVGTYHEDDIGASCYHNHLATFENVLTHLVDDRGVLVADMVAGVDSFASTLHAQFDLVVLAVEPTWRGIEVYAQYAALAKNADCLDSLAVVGNKIRTKADEEFIASRIPRERLLGFVTDSEYLRGQDKSRASLDVGRLDEGSSAAFARICEALAARPYDPQARLRKIWELHERYVAQAFIRERFGDLTGQIDRDFDFDGFIRALRNV
jgi:CO dehydrogenase maturation factor